MKTVGFCACAQPPGLVCERKGEAAEILTCGGRKLFFQCFLKVLEDLEVEVRQHHNEGRHAFCSWCGKKCSSVAIG